MTAHEVFMSLKDRYERGEIKKEALGDFISKLFEFHILAMEEKK